MLKGLTDRPTRGHTAPCRERVLSEMRKDPALAQKIAAAEKRKEEYLRQRDEERRRDEEKRGDEERKRSEPLHRTADPTRPEASDDENELIRIFGPEEMDDPMESASAVPSTPPLPKREETVPIPNPSATSSSSTNPTAGTTGPSASSATNPRTPIAASRKRPGDIIDGSYQEREEEQRRWRKRKAQEPDEALLLSAVS